VFELARGNGMDGGQENPYQSKLVEVTEGEWAGWKCYPGGDPFEDLAGPFYWKTDPDGRVRCAFRAEHKHMNGGLFLHGGCVMTFADFCLFAIAGSAIDGSRTVTATFNGEFVGSGGIGDLIECTGEVVKAGRSMVFLRGLITNKGEPVMSFSSVLKKVGTRG
jgi:acyl-coenzyme A thioesterase PaaI-like protein